MGDRLLRLLGTYFVLLAVVALGVTLYLDSAVRIGRDEANAWMGVAAFVLVTAGSGLLYRILARKSVELAPALFAVAVMVYGLMVWLVRRPRPFDAPVGDALVWALVCALGSFAIVELCKRLFGLRGVYQRRQVAWWLVHRGQAHVPGRRSTSWDRDPTKAPAFEQLLSAMSPEQQAFDLPIELLSAQINSCLDIVFAHPSAHAALLGALSGQQAVEKADGDGGSADAMIQDWESRALAQRVRTGLDHLQISIGQRWRRYVQGFAVLVSALLALVLTPTDSAYLFAVMLIGGVLSWSIRDVSAILERWRR
jgi:hypothetical protein